MSYSDIDRFLGQLTDLQFLSSLSNVDMYDKTILMKPYFWRILVSAFSTISRSSKQALKQRLTRAFVDRLQLVEKKSFISFFTKKIHIPVSRFVKKILNMFPGQKKYYLTSEDSHNYADQYDDGDLSSLFDEDFGDDERFDAGYYVSNNQDRRCYNDNYDLDFDPDETTLEVGPSNSNAILRDTTTDFANEFEPTPLIQQLDGNQIEEMIKQSHNEERNWYHPGDKIRRTLKRFDADDYEIDDSDFVTPYYCRRNIMEINGDHVYLPDYREQKTFEFNIQAIHPITYNKIWVSKKRELRYCGHRYIIGFSDRGVSLKGRFNDAIISHRLPEDYDAEKGYQEWFFKQKTFVIN